MLNLNSTRILKQTAYAAKNQPATFLPPSIEFRLRGAAEFGIRLSETRDGGALQWLEDGDVPLQIGDRAKLSIRLEVSNCFVPRFPLIHHAQPEGYRPFSRQKNQGKPCTRKRLVRLVAEVVNAFINDVRTALPLHSSSG